jgi:signal transduction histidine kinase
VLSACQREALYFVAREALWNIVRHSGAKHVAITLSREDGRVLLSVVDDGVGFDPSLVGGGETVGLRTMRERLELVRGTLELDSRPGAGTRVMARIPLP